jgi:hypothetical protein
MLIDSRGTWPWVKPFVPPAQALFARSADRPSRRAEPLTGPVHHRSATVTVRPLCRPRCVLFVVLVLAVLASAVIRQWSWPEAVVPAAVVVGALLRFRVLWRIQSLGMQERTQDRVTQRKAATFSETHWWNGLAREPVTLETVSRTVSSSSLTSPPVTSSTASAASSPKNADM